MIYTNYFLFLLFIIFFFKEEKAKGLEEQLTTITQDRDEKRTKFEDLQKQFEENSKNLTSVTNQLNKVKNEVQRYV